MQFTTKSAQLKSSHFHLIHLVGKIETCFLKTSNRIFGARNTENNA